MGSADPTVEYAPPKPSEFGYDAREYERQLQANQRDAEMRKAAKAFSAADVDSQGYLEQNGILRCAPAEQLMRQFDWH